MRSLDIALLHPPSILAKDRIPLGGAFNSGAGSTDLFVVFPAGLVNMAHSLLREGFRIRIYNLADMMLRDKFTKAPRRLPP